MKRSSWIEGITSAIGSGEALASEVREELSDLDAPLFEAWNLGENILLAWTQDLAERCFLAVRQVLLARLRAGVYEDSAHLEYIAGELESGIWLIRLLPLANVFRLFPRLVHDLAQQQGKEVELAIEGDDTAADKRILEEMKDPLMHILGNSVGHGIEPPICRLRSPPCGCSSWRSTAIPTGCRLSACWSRACSQPRTCSASRGTMPPCTGMGADGAQGMLAIARAGGLTIAQDEASSIVFGMPKQAIAAGAARYVLALDEIAPALIDVANGVAPQART